MGKAGKEIEASLVPKGPNVTRNLVLPLEGRSLESIEKEMQKMDEELGGADHWNGGKLSGAVYHGGDDMEVRCR
jgi:sphinganine-1-phosphate aldolase